MISPRKLEEREARKQRILTGALRVFQKKGLDGATMDEIAREAGFGKGTLYYYFESKEEVFCTIMEKGWITLWVGIEEIIHADLNPKQRLLKILNKTVSIIYSDRNLYYFLFSAPKAITHMPENQQTWKSYQNKLYGALLGIIEEGIEQGEFPKLNADLLLRGIGGLFHGLVFMGHDKKLASEEDIEELLSKFLALPEIN
jgi:AcrR family transcriptional regulator